MSVLYSAQCDRQGIVFNDYGNLYLYDDMREIQYHFNLTSFIENAESMHECANKMKMICSNTTQRQNCEFFTNNIHYNKAQIDRDIFYIKMHKNPDKRSIGLLFLFGEVFKRNKRSAYNSDIGMKQLQQLESQLLLLKDTMKTNQQVLTEMMEIMKEYRGKITKLEGRVNNMTEFYDVLHICSSLMTTHVSNVNKVKMLLSEEPNKEVFSMIDLNKFENQIESIRSNLSEHLILPELKSIIELSQIHTIVNDSQIVLSIRVPLLRNNPIKIREVIPIPMTIKNETKLIKWDSKYILGYTNLTIRTVTPELLSDCQKSGNLTICNSIYEQNFDKPDNCTLSILSNIHETECEKSKMSNENYFIEINDRSMYCHINEPVQLRLICIESEDILNLTESQIIQYSDNCDVTKMSNDSQIDENQAIYLKMEQIFVKPDLYIYNSSIDWYTNITILSKYELQYMSLINVTQTANESLIELRKIMEEENNKLDLGFFSECIQSVKDFFGSFVGKIVTTILSYIILPLLLYQLVILLLKKCLCRNSS